MFYGENQGCFTLIRNGNRVIPEPSDVKTVREGGRIEADNGWRQSCCVHGDRILRVGLGVVADRYNCGEFTRGVGFKCEGDLTLLVRFKDKLARISPEIFVTGYDPAYLQAARAGVAYYYRNVIGSSRI